MIHMTDDQAKELSRAIYGNISHAKTLQFMADSFVAHRIINGYMSRAMMSDYDVALFAKTELGMIQEERTEQILRGPI